MLVIISLVLDLIGLYSIQNIQAVLLNFLSLFLLAFSIIFILYASQCLKMNFVIFHIILVFTSVFFANLYADSRLALLLFFLHFIFTLFRIRFNATLTQPITNSFAQVLLLLFLILLFLLFTMSLSLLSFQFFLGLLRLS